jgi:hypothetical protein
MMISNRDHIKFLVICIYLSSCLSLCVKKPGIENINGGISDANLTDPNLIAAANYGIYTQYGSLTNFTIIDAKQQVVAGIRYILIVKFAFSSQVCAIQLTYQSWLNEYIIESTICDSQSGPFLQASIQDTTIIKQTNEAIKRLYRYEKQYELESAQRISVNGYIYKLIVRFPDSGEVCTIEIYSFINSQSIRSNTCSGAPSSLGFFPPTNAMQ